MTADYVMLAHAPSEHAFVLHKISDVEDWYEIVEGEPRAAGFPDDVTHTVSADYPHNLTLDDVFRSPNRVFLVSVPLKHFMEQRGVQGVDFLPVTLLDHRGKPCAQYSILAPVGPLDCLDIAASKAKTSKADKDYVGAIDGVVLRPEKLQPDRQIMKVKRLFEQVFVRRDLAEAMTAAGFTGFAWIELADFRRD